VTSIAVVGNCSVDLVVQCEDSVIEEFGLRVGESNNAMFEPRYKDAFNEILKQHAPEIHFGGGAGNVAAMCGGLKSDVVLVGHVGNDEMGQRFVDNAISSGCTSLIAQSDEHVTSQILVLVHSNKDRTFIIEPGANAHVEIPETTDVHVLGVDGHTLEYDVSRINVLRELNARRVRGQRSVISAADASVIEMNRALFDEWLDGSGDDIYVFSEPELFELHHGSREEGIERLRTRNVTSIVTLAEEGSVVISEGEVHHIEPYFVPADQVVDLVGAGDAFLGGFLHGFAHLGLDLLEAARLGNKCASEIIQVRGARL
jgi:sugar/nucleoside kinase (ribokinase family)